jgi:hypothetical protein
MPLASAGALNQAYDVCIVGAGPAGLACAFSCHDRGMRVLVLDAGGRRPVPGTPDLLAAEIVNPNAHDPVEIISASALGGSSHWWGGRSVPMDETDMRGWPLSWSEMLPWWRTAAQMIGAGAVVGRAAPGKFADLNCFLATTAESWAPRPVLARHWRPRLEAADGPTIILDVRVTGLRRDGEGIVGIEVLSAAGPCVVAARHFVLACGGLAGLRLMLQAQRADPSLFGGPDGPLGRGYMGHLAGSIADIVFADRSDNLAFAYFKANGGYMARRRLLPRAESIEKEGLPNIAFWLANPARGDPSHGSATASARFLAAAGVRMLAGQLSLEIPEVEAHLANITRAPLSAITGLTQAALLLAAARVTRQRHLPKRFLSSGDGGWRLVYHAEQPRHLANRVSLSTATDSIGQPKLHIDFRYLNEDVDSVVRWHHLLDADLRQAGAGSLRWTSHGDPRATIHASARDGYHQLGGAAMSRRPSEGVVDSTCRVHGLRNLWIASSSVFPSGGQANPTLTIIALACRIADTIAGLPPIETSKAVPAVHENCRPRRVLVVEDDFLLATEIASALERRGLEVVGPVSNRSEAVALIESGSVIHGAVLDVDLRGDMVYPVADMLRACGVPFGFAGSERAALPPAYRDAPFWMKPFDADRVAGAIAAMMPAESPELERARA